MKEYIAILTFKGVIIDRIVMKTQSNTVPLAVPAYGYLADSIKEGNKSPPQIVPVYKMMFNFEKILGVDDVKQIVYSEYSFAGIQS